MSLPSEQTPLLVREGRTLSLTVSTRPATPPPPPRPAPPVRLAQRIYFDKASARLGRDASAALDAAVTYVQQQGEAVVRLECRGFTDSDGSTSSNQTLSLERALAVKGALGERLAHSGLGSLPLVATGQGELPGPQAEHRRVEFWVTPRAAQLTPRQPASPLCGQRPDPELDVRQDYLTAHILQVLGDSARANGAPRRGTNDTGQGYFVKDAFYIAWLPLSGTDGGGRVVLHAKANVYERTIKRAPFEPFSRAFKEPLPTFLALRGERLLLVGLKKIREEEGDHGGYNNGGRNLFLREEACEPSPGDVSTRDSTHYVYRLGIDAPTNVAPSSLEVVVGQRLRVYFATGSAGLDGTQERVKALVEYVSLGVPPGKLLFKKLAIVGHTDDVDYDNQQLSKERAVAVREHLLGQVPGLRDSGLEFTLEYAAASRPLIDPSHLQGEALEAARRKNRRVEVEVRWDLEKLEPY